MVSICVKNKGTKSTSSSCVLSMMAQRGTWGSRDLTTAASSEVSCKHVFFLPCLSLA